MAKDLRFALLLDCYGSLLTERQAAYMELYYCEDLSLGEIAEDAGVSRQAVRDAVKRGEELLLGYEAKLGFAAQHTAWVEKLEELQRRIGSLEGRIPPEQLAALCIGCCGMGLAGLAAAWPLGLGAEVRAALHPDRARQKAKKA